MPFNFQPTLRGELVALRPLRADDWPALYAAASDAGIWAGHPAHDRWQEPVFRQLFEEGLAPGGALLATDVKTGEVIGSSRYHRYRPEAEDGGGEIEIGYSFLVRSRWGGAYNRDMKFAMLRHAFGQVAAVAFVVAPTNLRSQRAMEKIGGVRSGMRINSKGEDHVLFLIRKAAFMRLHSGPGQS